MYSTEDTVINVELINFSFDTEPSIIEIVWLDTGNYIGLNTGSVVFYSEAKEASLTIDIDLQPGNYMLRVRSADDWDTYWNTYWPGWGDTSTMIGDENADTAFSISSTYFSVIGSSNLINLKGTAWAAKYPDTDLLLSATLEWDGTSDGGSYTVKRVDEKGKVTYIEDICDNHIDISDLSLGGIYTYTVSDGKNASNPIVINLSAIPPLEYAGNNNDKVIVLKIGDPWIYSADDKQSALEGVGLEQIKTVGGNDLGVVPIILNDRTMIPVAILVRETGGMVTWDGEQRLVTIKKWDSTIMDFNTLEIPIGSLKVYLNGEERAFDTPAQINRGRTLVPIRLLELLDYEVYWVSDSKSIVICYSSV